MAPQRDEREALRTLARGVAHRASRGELAFMFVVLGGLMVVFRAGSKDGVTWLRALEAWLEGRGPPGR